MVIDWTKMYEQYRGLWVALEDDQVTVVASGETPREVLDRAQKQGKKNPILFHVPTEILPYVGSAFV